MESKFSKGDVVKLVNTDKTGVICEDPKEISGEMHYVLFIDNSKKTYSEDSLEPAKTKNNDLISQFKENKFSSLNDFNNYLTFLKIERPLTNNLYAFLSSRTEFLIHQFKPVIKFLKSPYQRLLIADEVGVGKTIEAGIIYTELLSRFNMKNVLFICPSSLCYKWQKELRKRFSEDFGILDSKSIKLFFKKFERNPNGVQLKAIASIQMLRNEDLLNQFERLQIPWDLILIDEAHHMRNEGTRSHNLGRIMSNTAESMIMMSATPLQLGNKDLFNLFRILMPDEFNNFDTFEDQVKPNEYINLAVNKISKRESAKDILEQLTKVEQTSQKQRFLSNPNYLEAKRILSGQELTHSDIIVLQKILSELNILANIYTRTKKKEISVDSPIREPATIKVEFTPEEFNYYNMVGDLFLRLNPGVPPGFLLQMPLRQVASCIPASIEYLKDVCSFGEINLEKEDIDEDEEETGKLPLSKSDINSIKELINYAEENLKSPDSKSTMFIKTIDEILNQKGIKKIIVFSFFKRTLRFLQKELEKKGLKTAKIDGDVPFSEREVIFEKFADPDGYQILLSSEVGGEGLDMQFCNCMVNYDLPWNPMKVEQRIGRLDRYGQKNPKIHIYNFSVENTIESNIFLRLCNRIGVFEQYVGELEPILGDAIKKLTSEIVNTDLTSEQQKQKADQVALVIEKKKKDLELFDNDRKKFIGQDNYFTEEISDIKKQERFITPNEIKNLVLLFLEENYVKTKISKQSDLTLIIKPDDEFREFVRNNIFTRKDVSTEFTEKFLDLINKDSFRITFDYKTANENPDIEFITLRHNLIKSIVSFYERKRFNMLTRASYKDSDLQISGEFAFFIYLLEIKGYSHSLTFVPVVLNCKTNEINTDLSKNLFKILKSSKDETMHSSSCEKFEELESTSLQQVIEQKKHKKNELEKINESLINDMVSSLEQSYRIKINNIDEVITRMKNNLNERTMKIIKMKESQKINVTRNFESKKTEFESKRKIIVSHELIAGGFLNVN